MKKQLLTLFHKYSIFMIQILKFGGASIKDAQSIINVAKILSNYNNDNIVIVFSAIGKITNLLEELVELYVSKSSLIDDKFNEVKQIHYNIIKELFPLDNEIYIIEVNPRASRTVPFISKAIGRSLVKIASKAMIGKSLIDQRFNSKLPKDLFFVKEAVMPFDKFPLVDPILGPEMKSTGEVMGIGATFGEAYAKAQKGANKVLPRSGSIFVSVKDSDKKYLDQLVPLIVSNGFSMIATGGTAEYIQKLNYPVKRINKVMEGRPHTVDSLLNNEIDIVINTTEGAQSIEDSAAIRQTALRNKIFCTTTMFGALAVMEALKSQESDWTYSTLQEINK